MLQIQHLTKNYQNISALQDINLTVDKGEIFGIIGKSGAGKSTLIRCVNLLETPSHGNIVIADTDLTTLSSKQLRIERRQIGMIFQHFNLLESRTAYENVALPLELAGKNKKEIAATIQPLLELVNLADRKNHYPTELSGGQKQRVAIARALVTKPKLLLCDEATSALDPESTASILKLLKQINRKLNLTILLITHEMEVVKNICDKVAILDNGYLVEQGDIIKIFTTPESEITKSLTKKALHLELPMRLQQEFSIAHQNPVIQLTFVGAVTNEPIITTLSRKFNVTASILQADLETIHGSTMGFLICRLSGDQAATENALQYLNTSGIKTEVIGYE